MVTQIYTSLPISITGLNIFRFVKCNVSTFTLDNKAEICALLNLMNKDTSKAYNLQTAAINDFIELIMSI